MSIMVQSGWRYSKAQRRDHVETSLRIKILHLVTYYSTLRIAYDISRKFSKKISELGDGKGYPLP